MIKKCTTCNEEKEANENFGKHKGFKDGYRDECKKCRNQKLKKHWNNTFTKLLCSTCQEYLNLSNFNKNKDKVHRDYHDSSCKKCKVEKSKKRRMQRYNADPLERLLVERIAGARDRAKRKNIYFDLEVDSIKKMWELQDGKCALSGIKMTHVMGEGRTPTNISIDQIEASKGYTINNIQLVCMAVNQMKSDLTNEELLLFCNGVINNSENARTWNKGK